MPVAARVRSIYHDGHEMNGTDGVSGSAFIGVGVEEMDALACW